MTRPTLRGIREAADWLFPRLPQWGAVAMVALCYLVMPFAAWESGWVGVAFCGICAAIYAGAWLLLREVGRRWPQ